MSTIDTLLYRPLKQGTAYQGLIPAYQGTDFKFDKNSDNSTTYDTLRFMAQWSTKYASQMKRIAPLMRGKTIQETANNIYQFLYNHFQYKLDGEMQNLYSPSAAWHFRKTGFDCKTYSILASTILQNLNITHAFRMVQQAGIMPGEWSHVYVVIPNGNQTAIIDATTHTNKEVSFTQKHDYTMKHRGLASPYINGLGCACQGTSLNKTGLGSPATMATTVANFHAFLNEIESKGVPKEVTTRMLDLVKWNVQNGIDPNMQEIVAKAYAGTKKGLGLLSPISSLTPADSTYGGFTTTMPTGNYVAPTTTGTSLLSNMSVGGVNVSGAISAVTGLLTGNPLAAINLITSLIPVEKTFGAVFANGFNLSCWGSTVTPAMSKGWGEKDFPMVLNQTLSKGVNQANINMYLDAMNHLETQSRNWAAKMRSCSRDGLNNYADAAKTAKEGVIEGLKSALMQQGIQMNPIASSATTTAKLPFTFVSSVFTNEYVPYKVERFNIIVPRQEAPPPTAQQTANTDNTGAPPETTKKSSATIPLLIGGAALALKFLI